MSDGRLGEAFGVAKSTMGGKARQVRDLLRVSYFSASGAQRLFPPRSAVLRLAAEQTIGHVRRP